MATVTAGRTDKRVNSGRERSHGPAVGARFERAVDAAHSLSDLLWEELHASAARARSTELAKRIADVAATVALLAGGDERNTPAAPPAAPAAPRAMEAHAEAVLIDERDEVPTERWWASSTRRSGDDLEGNGRHAERPAWLALIETALAQFERDRDPFAALLIEVLDAAEPPREQIEATIARALDAILPVALAPESSQRYWLLVPQTDRVGAAEVAELLTATPEPVAGEGDAADRYFAALAERRSRADEGAPALRIVAGTAACPEDGQDVSALVAQAHIELAQARSSSVPFAAATELTQR